MKKLGYTLRLLLFLVPIGVALVAVLFLLKGLGAPLSTPVPFTPTPDPAQAVVARVGEQRITFGDWAVAFYLDALMSRLSGQPAPTARETLDRLVNDALILSAAADKGFDVGETDVEARLLLLQANWGLTDEQITAELTAIGLTREVWAEAVARLLTVERYLAEVVWADVAPQGQPDALAAWLEAHRAQAQVEVDTSGLQPVLPEPLPVPTATALAFSPLPTFTTTPLVASPLATPSPSPTPVPTATPVLVSPLPTPTPSPSPTRGSPGSPGAGQPAPDFGLVDASGQLVLLSGYRRQSTVVLVFFRTTG
jgi:hypothetical protein